MSEVKQYTGGCHCGKVRYQVSADLSQPAITCNCSICTRTGALLTFVPAAQFTLEQGEDVLTDYQFNKRVVHHLFCSTCGVRSFARGTGRDGSPMVAINARCLEGVEPADLKLQHVNGRGI